VLLRVVTTGFKRLITVHVCVCSPHRHAIRQKPAPLLVQETGMVLVWHPAHNTPLFNPTARWRITLKIFRFHFHRSLCSLLSTNTSIVFNPYVTETAFWWTQGGNVFWCKLSNVSSPETLLDCKAEYLLSSTVNHVRSISHGSIVLWRWYVNKKSKKGFMEYILFPFKGLHFIDHR
jgi:hypothetical protein